MSSATDETGTRFSHGTSVASVAAGRGHSEAGDPELTFLGGWRWEF